MSLAGGDVHLQEAFNVYGFPGPFAVERVLMGLRRILERTGLERRDVALLRGVARQLGWALGHPPFRDSPGGDP